MSVQYTRGVQYTGGYHEYTGGYHEQSGEISWVHWGIPWAHWGISWVHDRDTIIRDLNQTDTVANKQISIRKD